MLNPYRYNSCDLGYKFITDKKLAYRVSLGENVYLKDSEFAPFVYDFGFFPEIKQQKFEAEFDRRIEDTITTIVQDFFNNDPYKFLIYTCSISDSQQRPRKILFNKWYNNRRGFLKLYKEDAILQGDEVWYASLLIKNDHPHRDKIINCYNAEIEFLKQHKIL